MQRLHRRSCVALLSGIAALLAFTYAGSSAATAEFRRLTMEDGLSNDEVFTIFQDKQGYIWLGTADGLDRYDGYAFRVFRHDANDPASISGNLVRAICEDPEGRIWVGSYSDGLNLYDPGTGGFKHYRHMPGDPNSLISDDIWTLSALPDGELLIGTYDAGLDVFNPQTGQFKHFTAGAGRFSPTSNHITKIFVDSRSHVWLATITGLDEFDPAGKAPTHHFTTGNSDESNVIYGIAEDSAQRLWLTTQKGAYVYVPGETTLEPIRAVIKKVSPLDKAFLYAVYEDDEKNIWYGSTQAGVFLILHGSNEILNFQHRISDTQSLSANYIWNFFRDRSGYMWVATDNGVNLLDTRMLDIDSLKPSDIAGSPTGEPDLITALYQYRGKLLLGGTGGIYQYALSSQDDSLKEAGNVFIHLDPNKFGGVTAISGSTNQNLLAGTENGYLLEISPTGKLLQSWVPASKISPRPRAIHRILSDGPNAAYLATFSNGVLRVNLRTREVTSMAGTMPNELAANDLAEALYPTSPKKLWVGTFRGLFLLDVATNHSSLISLTPGTREPVIQGLYEDRQHNLWIATFAGLWRLTLDADGNPTSQPESIAAFRHTQMLAIESDAQDSLWLASINSLIRYNPETGDTLTFGRNQGSPISEYYSYGHTRTTDGRLWFAGRQGAIGFLPGNLKPNAIPPGVVLDGVTSYRNGIPSYMHLTGGRPLTLTYQDSISIFDIAAMDFGAPQANTYSYRLLGFQSTWTPPSTSHQITFTNLSPGRYRLEVRAANNWGVWSTTPASEEIIVLPPWWRTWWAYALYLLVIIGSSIGYIYSLKRKIEREQEISTNLREANDIKSNFVEKLESQVRKATHELRETLQGVNLKNAELEIAQRRAAEAEQIKSQFLANMSHELRTPLTGVLGYTKLLGSTQLNSEQKDYVGTIKQSSETLLAIINDTLDLSRLEAGKLLIDQVDFDLLEVIESTLELLAPTAYQKRLELVRVVSTDVPLHLRGDPLRLRQVLTNLLSNAIKFTEHGSVAIEVKTLSQDERETKLMFNISDTGIGIPSGELSKLFHAYARSRISTQHHVEGTGLGLAICKKLLDLMGGDIKVTSKVGTGTSFAFELVFKLQKNAEPRSRLPRKIKILLYDAHPLSNQAWRACLMRLGAEVETVPNLESVVSLKADAAIMVLSEKELTQLGELKRTLTPVLPPMLILAPRIERQALKDLSETLFHRVLSKTAREKTLYLELQSLLQTVVHDGDVVPRQSHTIAEPATDAPKILVADDNRINRRLLVTMLNHAGFRASEAANGLELLDLAAKGPWDAALLDIHMPGMDGIEAAKRLRESHGDALPPVIAMSADVMPETRKQVMEGIMDDFMVKPFSEQELVDKLRWHLDRHHRKKRTVPQ